MAALDRSARRFPGNRLIGSLLPLIALLIAAAPGAAQIERFSLQPPPDLLELTGHVGAPAPGETGGWDLTLGAGLTPTIYAFHLSVMRVLNSGRLPNDILFAVEPEHPNFRLFGTTEELGALAAANPAQLMTITGYRRRGSTNLLLTGLTVAPVAEPEPQATPHW